MKCTAIWGWLLAIGFLVGCQGETTKEDTGSAEPPSVTIPEAGENSAESAADDAEAPAGDPADADYDQSNADTASDVDATASDNTAVPNALELTPEEPSDPSEWTLDQFANELMGAAQGGDFTKAIEIANLALDKYPDSFEMQMNRMMLQLRIANALESQDKDQAAEQLVLVGDYARPLVETIKQQPESPQREQLTQIIALGIYQQARGLAHQGKQDEAMKTLDDAMQAGMTSFEQISEDEMFASVRDTEAFQQHVESLEKRALEHEFAETEPFEFDFALQNLANEEVKLSDFAGKFVIVDLWGTWCPPCRAEIPSFVKLQDAYPEDLAIVGITYEQAQGEEAVAQVRTFAEEQGINYSLVMGDEETSQKIPGFGSFPTTLFLDREGKVRLKIVGMHPYEKLESYLKYLMNEGQSEG